MAKRRTLHDGQSFDRETFRRLCVSMTILAEGLQDTACGGQASTVTARKAKAIVAKIGKGAAQLARLAETAKRIAYL